MGLFSGVFDVVGGIFGGGDDGEAIYAASRTQESARDQAIKQLQETLSKNIETREGGLATGRQDLETGVGAGRTLYDPYIQAGTGALQQYQDVLGGYGSFLDKVRSGQTVQDYYSSPLYDYQVEQAMKGVQQSAAARGNLYSEQTQRDLAEELRKLASQDYGNYLNTMGQTYSNQINSLNPLLQYGYGGASNLANLEAQTGANLSNLEYGTASGIAGDRLNVGLNEARLLAEKGDIGAQAILAAEQQHAQQIAQGAAITMGALTGAAAGGPMGALIGMSGGITGGGQAGGGMYPTVPQTQVGNLYQPNYQQDVNGTYYQYAPTGTQPAQTSTLNINGILSQLQGSPSAGTSANPFGSGLTGSNRGSSYDISSLLSPYYLG